MPALQETPHQPRQIKNAKVVLAPVLYNLSEIDYDGMVTVSGNTDAIVFDYQTAAGAFRIALPTVRQVKRAWNRSAVHFSRANF